MSLHRRAAKVVSDAKRKAAIENAEKATAALIGRRHDLSCQQCSAKFQSVQKWAMYCSPKCREAARVPVPGVCKVCGGATKRKSAATCSRKCYGDMIRAKPRRHNMVALECVHCREPFSAYETLNRKYCSYACHLASGGALRAGLAASRSIGRHRVKKDFNHDKIVERFIANGIYVIDLSRLGNGLPDLLVFCAGETRLVEVKNPDTSYGRRGANRIQMAWAADWRGGPVYIVRTVEEVDALCAGRIEEIEQIKTYYAKDIVQDVHQALKAVMG